MKTCPWCAEEIQDAAIVCRYCGRELKPKHKIGTSPSWGKWVFLIWILGLIAFGLYKAGVLAEIVLMQDAPVSVPLPTPMVSLNDFGSSSVTVCVAIMSKDGRVSGDRRLTVTGTVRNVCTDPVSNVRLVVKTMSDGNRVVSTAYGYIKADRLRAKESSDFEIVIQEDKNKSTGFVVEVDGAQWFK